MVVRLSYSDVWRPTTLHPLPGVATGGFRKGFGRMCVGQPRAVGGARPSCDATVRFVVGRSTAWGGEAAVPMSPTDTAGGGVTRGVPTKRHSGQSWLPVRSTATWDAWTGWSAQVAHRMAAIVAGRWWTWLDDKATMGTNTHSSNHAATRCRSGSRRKRVLLWRRCVG